jgi:hypothetical protein
VFQAVAFCAKWQCGQIVGLRADRTRLIKFLVSGGDIKMGIFGASALAAGQRAEEELIFIAAVAFRFFNRQHCQENYYHEVKTPCKRYFLPEL